MIALVEQRDPIIPLVVACKAVGLSRATFYRRRRAMAETASVPMNEVLQKPRKPNGCGLSEAERAHVLDTLN
jgi:hypothetical protein